MTARGLQRRQEAHVLLSQTVMNPRGWSRLDGQFGSPRTSRSRWLWGLASIVSAMTVMCGLFVATGSGPTFGKEPHRSVLALATAGATVSTRLDDSRFELAVAGRDSAAWRLADLLALADAVAENASATVWLKRSVEDGLVASTGWLAPAAGRVSSRYADARRHPILQSLRPHRGVDIAAPFGTPIVAPRAGVVSDVASLRGYGNVVVVYHGNGVETLYAHCSLVLVRKGQYVRRDDVVALVGDSGLTTGPHVHYEVSVDGLRIDPVDHQWD